MLKWLFIFLSFLSFSLSNAQTRAVKEGDYHVKHFRYYEAALSYKQAYEKNISDYDVAFKLAEAYKAYYNYSNAENYYKIVSENALMDYPMSQYWYAEMRKLRGDYVGAQKDFEKLLANPELLKKLEKNYAEKAELELLGCKMAINEIKKPYRDYHFYLLDKSINSKGSEYAPVIYENDTSLVFTSNKSDEEENPTGGVNNHFRLKRVDEAWEETLPDDEDGFYKAVNSKYNEGAGSFTADKLKYYFTRCDGKQKHAEFKEYNCLIYMTKKEEELWLTAVPLEETVNPTGEWTASPSVSANGDTLFFVSKRPGGVGMHDIWYSTSTGNENWSKSVNLEAINTPFIDVSPKYDTREHVLYFSSNGRESFGGLDIFIAKGEAFNDIRNAGLPFNSNKDDFYFVMGETKGYLASNREGGQGNDDIYWFNRKSSESVIVEIRKDSLQGMESVSVSGTVLTADSHQPVVDVKETLIDEEGHQLKTTRTNEEGEFRFDNLDANHSYKVVIEDAVDATVTHSSEVIVEDIKITGSSEEATEVHFENIYFDSNSSSIRPEATKVLEELVMYYKENSTIQIEIDANTDNIGDLEYNMRLSRRRGNAAYRYLINHGVDKSAIVLNAKGESDQFVPNYSAIGRQLNRRVEFTIIGGGQYSPHAMTYIVGTTTSLDQVASQFDMTIDELKEMNNIDSDNVSAFRPLRVRNIGDDDLIEPVTLANAQKKNNKYYKARKARFAAYQRDYDELNTTYSNYEKIKRELHLTEGQDYYVALPKNNLWHIAKLYGMTTEEIRVLNKLKDNRIYINQPIIVKLSTAPVAEDHYQVQEVDTVSSICERFGLSENEFLLLNILEGYTLRRGMLVKVDGE
jgi:peptidoglycan-associated lipoprotein